MIYFANVQLQHLKAPSHKQTHKHTKRAKSCQRIVNIDTDKLSDLY
jgi:hypothetical protein